MVLLRPLTGRLGMRRKSEWLGGVDVTRGRGGPVREHCTSMHCVGHHIQNEGCSYGAAEAPDRQAGHAPQT